jgi:hypothetical protein
MVDFRPVAYVIGRILIVLAILMLAPAIIDWRAGLENGYDFLASAALTGVVGGGADAVDRQCAGKAAGHAAGLSSDRRNLVPCALLRRPCRSGSARRG